MIEPPEAFVRTTVDREGEPGAAWLARLPALVEDLLACWDCAPDGELTHGGVGLAVPAPPGLPRLSEQAGAWEEQLREDAAELPHPLPGRALDAAVATVRELGPGQPDTLVHGDLHAGNILRADREPWLAVDPKGYVGDPAYDGGTLLKSRALSLIAADDPARAVHRVLDVFAYSAELDRERVQRWARFHAVQAALWGRHHGFRTARTGPRLDRLTAFADGLANLLTSRRTRRP
ncbi:aminoglycoside phosphotransferase family protein [Streptomyces sp. NPDC001272]